MRNFLRDMSLIQDRPLRRRAGAQLFFVAALPADYSKRFPRWQLYTDSLSSGATTAFQERGQDENGFTVVRNRARCSLCSVTRLTTRVQTNVPEAVSGAKVRSLSRLPHSRHRRPSGIASCGVRKRASGRTGHLRPCAAWPRSQAWSRFGHCRLITLRDKGPEFVLERHRSFNRRECVRRKRNSRSLHYATLRSG